MKVPLGLALLLGTGLTAGPQQPTFSSRVEAVRVDVLVTDRGKAVTGLRPEDFEVKDEGVLQEIDLVQLDRVPLNVVLGLDVSESVNGERLEHLQSAGTSLLRGLQKDDRAALLTFSHAHRRSLLPAAHRQSERQDSLACTADDACAI